MAKVDWSAIPGPKYYDPGRADDALSAVISPSRSVTDSSAAVCRAFGNDHAGTLYPAAVVAAEQLIKIAASHTGKPRQVALSVLLDWWGMFQAEPGYESFKRMDGVTVELIPAITEVVTKARPVISLIIEHDPAAKSARLLMKCIDAGWVVVDY